MSNKFGEQTLPLSPAKFSPRTVIKCSEIALLVNITKIFVSVSPTRDQGMGSCIHIYVDYFLAYYLRRVSE